MAHHISLFLVMIGANFLLSGMASGKVSQNRKLWIDPNAKPTSNVGWDVIISIICSGKYSTVNDIKFINGLQKLGFPIDSSRLKFGGNAATSNWRSISSFTINIPKAKNAASALAACSALTVKSLSATSGVNIIEEIFMSSFKIN